MKGVMFSGRLFRVISVIIIGGSIGAVALLSGGCACGDSSKSTRQLASNQSSEGISSPSTSLPAAKTQGFKMIHGMVNDLHGKEEMNAFVGISNRATDKLAVVLKFYSNGCGACQSMKEHDKKLSSEFKHRIAFGAVEVDAKDQKNSEISRELNVEGIPTYVTFEDGKEVERFVGGDPYALKDMLDRYAKKTS